MRHLALLLVLVLLAHASGTYRLSRDKDYRANSVFEPHSAVQPLNFEYVDPVATRAIHNVVMAATDVPGQNVYVSLTTISSRQTLAHNTVANLLLGTVRPQHIFLFVSEDAHLLDSGINSTTLLPNLRSLAAIHPDRFSIIFTRNTGPHRKLLPLLAQKWDEDCVIITVDDETIMDDPLTRTGKRSTIVERLLLYHNMTGGGDVVSLRARRLGLCRTPPHKATPYRFWRIPSDARREMLLMPTGTGGVLYRPRFFHSVIFDNRLIHATSRADDLMFRLATMSNGVYVSQSPRLFNRNKETTAGRHKLAMDGRWERDRAWRSVYKALARDGRNEIAKPLVFPLHWGSPPSEQTRDLRELPNNYGMGSSTLASWINSMMAVDWGNHRLYGTLAGTDESNYGVEETYPAPPALAAGAMRRLMVSLDEKKSLYEANQHGGNDAAWRLATSFLAKEGVLNIHKFTDNFARRERFGCLKSYWDAVQLNPAYTNVTIPDPPGSCCIVACGRRQVPQSSQSSK